MILIVTGSADVEELGTGPQDVLEGTAAGSVINEMPGKGVGELGARHD
jgi:hypothetical protein